MTAIKVSVGHHGMRFTKADTLLRKLLQRLEGNGEEECRKVGLYIVGEGCNMGIEPV